MTDMQALRNNANSIIGILENIAGYEPPDIDSDNVELRFEDECGVDTGCDVSIVDQCQKTADVMRALLDKLEAADKRMAKFESDIKSANERYENRTPTQWAYDQACVAIGKHRSRAEAAEKRIAELENDEVRQRLANAEQQLHMAEVAKHNLRATRKAQFRKRKLAERRVAELEASHVQVIHARDHYKRVASEGIQGISEARRLTVNLPQGYVIRPGHPINEPERAVMIPKDGGEWLSRIDVEIAIHAAGVKVGSGE